MRRKYRTEEEAKAARRARNRVYKRTYKARQKEKRQRENDAAAAIMASSPIIASAPYRTAATAPFDGSEHGYSGPVSPDAPEPVLYDGLPTACPDPLSSVRTPRGGRSQAGSPLPPRPRLPLEQKRAHPPVPSPFATTPYTSFFSQRAPNLIPSSERDLTDGDDDEPIDLDSPQPRPQDTPFLSSQVSMARPSPARQLPPLPPSPRLDKSSTPMSQTREEEPRYQANLPARDEADPLIFSLNIRLRLPRTLPFYLHILIEIPAAIHFFLCPTSQLLPPASSRPVLPASVPVLAPTAALIIQQYAVLLLVSNLVALIFALRPTSRQLPSCTPKDPTSRQVAAALALYHIVPVYRAAARLLMLYGYWDAAAVGAASWDEEIVKEWWRGKEMGGPWIHLGVHVVCCTGLVWFALVGMYSSHRWQKRDAETRKETGPLKQE